MRKQFVKTMLSIMEQDSRVVLLLGDIGVHGFREAFERFPKRVFNLGVCEQGSVGLAAGLALSGMIPVYHTIAPFLVERAFEALKIDFGYQGLGGNFVSVGASYDYAALGCTHHCPGDVAILKTIPNMEIFVPGSAYEFDAVFRDYYSSGKPSYFRMSERTNSYFETTRTTTTVIQTGSRGKVVAIGPMLDTVIDACKNLDVSILYRIKVSPFDVPRCPMVVIEPFYEGTMASDFSGLCVGVPRKFLTNYGTVQEHDEACGLTAPQIRKRIIQYFNL